MTTASERAISELIDREQIREVLCRYCRGTDRLDRTVLASVYHPGAVEVHGDYVGDAVGFIDWAFTRSKRSYRRIRHSLGNSLFDIRGDVALIETYFSASCELLEKRNGVSMARIHDGRYVDRFERRNGEWLISKRVVVKDFIRVVPLSDGEDSYVSSGYWPDDYWYVAAEENFPA